MKSNLPQKWEDLNNDLLSIHDETLLTQMLETELATRRRRNTCRRIVSRINKVRGSQLHAKILALLGGS